MPPSTSDCTRLCVSQSPLIGFADATFLEAAIAVSRFALQFVVASAAMPCCARSANARPPFRRSTGISALRVSRTSAFTANSAG
jgi:hypothetical protein